MEKPDYRSAQISTDIAGFLFLGASIYLLNIYPGGAAIVAIQGILVTSLGINDIKNINQEKD